MGKWHLGYCHRDYTPTRYTANTVSCLGYLLYLQFLYLHSTRRGFDSFFGILSQQTDHYTREHMINK